MTQPMKPDMPIGSRTYAQWLGEHGEKLMTWFKASHGHDNPSVAEWCEFTMLAFDAQVVDEWKYGRRH